MPYSAGSYISVLAPHIEQAGVLRAPLGRLDLGSNTPFTQFSSSGQSTTFQATKTLSLEAGSITSVSAAGLKIPYGTTTDLTEYFFTPTVLSPLTAPPSAELRMAGDSIVTAPGATVDASGGGELYAYEFVAGTGGSHDVLSRFNADSFSSNNGFQYADGRQVYAILPSGSAPTALYDPLYSGDYGSLYGTDVGKTVHLDAAPGVAVGDYVLLPAQYALLPGAMRIVENVGSAPPIPNASATLADGSVVVGGVYGISGTNILQSQRRSFTIQSQDVFSKYSKIELTSATTDFTALAQHRNIALPRLPNDAARIVISPLTMLKIGDPFDTDPAEDGRGSQVDLSGALIDIVSPGAAPRDGAVTLVTSDLANLNAASLLIGGVRTDKADGSTDIKVTSHEINVLNDGANPLSAPEIILAVDGKKSILNVADGATIAASGSLADARDGDYNVAYFSTDNGGNVIADNTGAGSVLRVANGVERLVNRSGALADDATKQSVTFTIGAAAIAGDALALDTSRNMKIDAAASLAARQIAVSSDDIAFSTRTFAVPGFVISPELEQILGAAQRLTLRSSKTIGFTPGTHAFNDLRLDAPGIRLVRPQARAGVDPLAVTIEGREISIGNSSEDLGGCTVRGALGCDETGNSLIVNATSLRFGSGTFRTIYGFDQSVGLTASSGVYYEGKGVFDVGGAALNLTTPFLVDRGTGAVPKEGAVQADLEIYASGAVTIAAPAGSMATPTTPLAPGARLAIGSLADPAQQVTIDGALLRATAGTIDIKSQGDIAVTGNAVLATPSYAQTFGDSADPVTVSARGGSIAFVSRIGDIDLGADTRIAIGGATGKAGLVSLIASEGAVSLAGTIDAAAPDAQASFTLDSGTGGFDFASFVAQHGAEFTGDVSVRTGVGDLALNAGQSLKLTSLKLTSDGGTTSIAGRVDSSGINGGDIALYGRDGVSLAGTASLDAHADGYADTDTRQAKAGDITFGVGTDGTISVASGATIDLTARRAGNRLIPHQQTDPRTLNQVTAYTFVEADRGGTLTLRAPVIEQPGADTVDVAFTGTVSGARDITVEGYRRYDLADVAGDNNFTGVTVGGGQATLNLGTAAPGKANFLADNAPGTLVDFIQNFDISGARSKLGGLTSLASYHERPAVQLDYSGDIVLASNWNLGAGTVDIDAAVAAGDMRLSTLGPRDDGSARYEVVPGREADLFQRFVKMTYRVGGAVDGEAGRLTLRAGRDLDIRHSITDGFFAFSDQTDPDYISYQFGGGKRSFNPAIDIRCGGDACDNLVDFAIDTRKQPQLPKAATSIDLTLTRITRGEEIFTLGAAPYSAAANSAAASGLQANGAGDPIGSAQLFPLLADGSTTDSFRIQIVGGAGSAPSADPLHIDRGTGGNVTVSGETSYQLEAAKPSAKYAGSLQLNYTGNDSFFTNDLLNNFALQSGIDADQLANRSTRVQFGNVSPIAAQFLRQAAQEFFAAFPGQVQFIGPVNARTGLAAPFALVAQFLESTDASGERLIDRFGDKIIDGSFNFKNPSPAGRALNPDADTVYVRSLVRTGTGSIDVAAAADVDLRNGDTPIGRNKNGGKIPPTGGQLAQVGGTAIYTAGHVVVPTAAVARVVGTDNSLAIDPVAYALTGDLRDQFWLPSITGRLQANPVYASGGGSIAIVAGNDVLGRRDVWSEGGQGFQSNSSTKAVGGVDRTATRPDMMGTSDQRWRVGLMGYASPGSDDTTLATNIRVNPQLFSSGVGTLGGGDVSIQAGGDVRELTVALDTTVTTGDVGDGFGQMIFGGGNLEISAGHDVAGGRFDISTGIANISARSDIGSSGLLILEPRAGSRRSVQQENLPEIRLTDTEVSLSAGGSVNLGMISALGVDSVDGDTDSIDRKVDQNALGYYTGNSALSVTTTGNFSLDGGAAQAGIGFTTTNILPATLDITSFGGNIDLGALQSILYPSATGQLSLLAGGTLAPATIDVDDGDPSLLPGIFSASAVDVEGKRVSGRGGFTLPVTLPTTSDGDRRLYHNPSLTHAGDATPVRIAAGGDLVDLTLYLPKQARISAGRDIVNMMFNGQNLAADDVTRIVAGRDITATTTLATYDPSVRGRTLVQGNQFIIGGPGSFYLEAGRDMGPFLNSAIAPIVDRQSGKIVATGTFPGGILSVGNDYNPWLAPKSADIYAFFGISKGMDFAALRDTYVDPANTDALDGDLFEQDTDSFGNKTPDRSRPIYSPILVEWMQENEAGALLAAFGTSDVTAAQAYSVFKALPDLVQRRFLLDKVYFNELAMPSRPDGPSYLQYVRGYRAVDTLFPASAGYTANDLSGDSNGGAKVSTGNLDLRLAAIETTRGSNITILGPGGNAVLGSVVRTSAQAARRAYQTLLLQNQFFPRPGFKELAVPVTGIPVGYEGVLTLRGGTIHGFTDADFRLNQSRLFAQQSGDIVLWSSNGDLNAGQGPKSAVNVPPSVVRFNPNGGSEIDSAGGVVGAGIAGFAAIRRLNQVTGLFELIDALNDSDVAAAAGQLSLLPRGAQVTVNGKTYSRDLPTITLVAPAGTVDAGDAGVRAGGDIFVAAAQVANADNFKVGGTAIGVPSLTATATPALPAGAASALVANVFRADQRSDTDQRSRISVDVLGYYGSDSDCKDEKGNPPENCPN